MGQGGITLIVFLKVRVQPILHYYPVLIFVRWLHCGMTRHKINQHHYQRRVRVGALPRGLRNADDNCMFDVGPPVAHTTSDPTQKNFLLSFYLSTLKASLPANGASTVSHHQVFFQPVADYVIELTEFRHQVPNRSICLLH